MWDIQPILFSLLSASIVTFGNEMHAAHSYFSNPVHSDSLPVYLGVTYENKPW